LKTKEHKPKISNTLATLFKAAENKMFDGNSSMSNKTSNPLGR